MKNAIRSRNRILRTGIQAAKTVLTISITFSIALAMATALARPAAAQTFSVLHEFKGGANDGFNPHAGLVQDAAGNFFGTTFAGGSTSEGTVYKMTPAGRITVLFTFNNLNGSFPESSLVFDKAGNLYGTAIEGPGGSGVLFRIAKDGTEDTFHAFIGGQGSEAAVPSGGEIIDAAGNLYGATLLGGLGSGAIYRVDPNGGFDVLYDFLGQSDGAEPEGPLVRDAAGNLYGSALLGGTRNEGTIFKLSTDGTLSVLHTFTGGSDGSSPQGGLLMDSAGNLFGSTFAGGDAGKGTVFEITKAGKFRRLHSFTGGNDGTNPNGSLILDAAGNLYGTTQIGGAGALGTVFKLSPSRVITVLHAFSGGKDGATPFGGLIRDAAGNLFGTADQNFLAQQRGGTIFKITP